MTNPFDNRSLSLGGPASDLMPVTPSDSVDLTTVGVALYVETGGTVSFETVAGQDRLVTLTDGMILPVGVRRVNATGTTAAGIHVFTVS